MEIPLEFSLQFTILHTNIPLYMHMKVHAGKWKHLWSNYAYSGAIITYSLRFQLNRFSFK